MNLWNNGTPNPVLLSVLDRLKDDRRAKFERIKLYREYESGQKPIVLFDSQKNLLGGDPQFQINICPTIIDAKCDRLNVNNLVVTIPEDEDERGALMSGLLRHWWDRSRMDENAGRLHYAASRDGDGYLIVSHDGKNLVFTIEPAFDGDEGTMLAYRDGKPAYAIRRWSYIPPEDPLAEPIRRMNLYYPDRVEKYYSLTKGAYVDAGYVPYVEAGQESHIVWNTDTGTEMGQPLGIPVIHFRNNLKDDNYGVSELANVCPALQDALNNAGVNTLAAARLAGFPLNYTLNAQFESDIFPVYPGAIINIPSRTGATAGAGQFPAANLVQLIEEETNIKRTISLITSTPLSLLNPSSQIASEGTLQQMEAPLLARVKHAQQSFGNAYEDMARQALKMAIVFGNDPELAGVTLADVDTWGISADWTNPQTRNEYADAQTLEIHQRLGVPLEIIWEKLSYTADQIERMKALRERESLQANINALRVAQTDQANQLVEAQAQLVALEEAA